MKHGSLDSSHRDASDGRSFSIIDRWKDIVFYFLKALGNISRSIDSRSMKLPPLDASRYDESNKPYFIFFKLLDFELLW